MGDGGCIGEGLNCEEPAGAIGARNQLLADHTAQRFADHDADLPLLIDWKNIKHTIQRARGGAGMQCSQHKVARL